MDENEKIPGADAGDELLGKAISAVGLVEYQSGAVVSRTILKKKTGTVTLFAFDAGEGLSEHTAPFEALVFILDGSGEITISGRTLTAETGQLVIMPAGEPHALHARDRFKMALVMIRS